MTEKLTLHRFSNHPEHGVLGELFYGRERIAYTIEQPWRNNRPFESCIPEGTYSLEPWSSEAHPDTFVLVNHELNVKKYQDPNRPNVRYACLIHVANWAEDVQGCIGPGRRLDVAANKSGKETQMVTHSSTTTGQVIDLIKEKEIKQIQIQWRTYIGR